MCTLFGVKLASWRAVRAKLAPPRASNLHASDAARAIVRRHTQTLRRAVKLRVGRWLTAFIVARGDIAFGVLHVVLIVVLLDVRLSLANKGCEDLLVIAPCGLLPVRVPYPYAATVRARDVVFGL